MTRHSFINAVVSLFVGIVTMALISQTFPYTSAIASPAGFFEWFREHATVELGLLAFGFMVSTPVIFVGLGLATLCLCWRIGLPKYIVAMLVMVGALFVLFVALPIHYGEPLFPGFNWWSGSFVYATVLSPFLAAYFWRKRAPSLAS